jgi:putative ABC transport system permease protein
MALGVMLVVAVLAIHGVVQESFQRNASLGYNMILGAKGGKLQLTLNSVYYLSQPIENVPYDFYLEFLSEPEREIELQNALQPPDEAGDGKYAAFTAFAVPLCLGDYYGSFRVVGTTPDMFDQLRYGPEADREYTFAQGRNFRRVSPEHGFFEAVVGSAVARKMDVQLGQQISTTHGDPEGFGHGRKFTVVGILEPSGTPNDRAVFVNMEGFYLMEGHAKPLPDDHTFEDDETGEPIEDVNAGVVDQLQMKPLPVEQREVTAILLRTTSPLVTPGIKNTINEGQVAQAVLPVQEIYDLFDTFVTPLQMVLLVLTGLVCVVSGVSILVSIYNSMSERRHEIAVIRAMGASRGAVLSIVLLESIILSVGGGVLGWLMGHALIGAASPVVEQRTGVSPVVEQRTGVAVGFFELAPGIDIAWLLGSNLQSEWLVWSPELLLVPALVVLAVVVGFLPALSAYRTDVAASLGD